MSVLLLQLLWGKEWLIFAEGVDLFDMLGTVVDGVVTVAAVDGAVCEDVDEDDVIWLDDNEGVEVAGAGLDVCGMVCVVVGICDDVGVDMVAAGCCEQVLLLFDLVLDDM